MKKYLVRINIFFLLILFLGDGVNIFAKNNPNSVNFFKVGNSDCILIKSNTENILIDLGENKFENSILQYLKKENIEELDAIVLTNFNKNISNVLEKVMDNFKINNIYLPNCCDNKTNKDLIIKKLEEKNICYDFIEKGWSYNKGNIFIEAKSPIEKKENNNSIILYGVIDKIKYLFASDFLFNSKEDIKNLNNTRGVDVLKVSNSGKKGFTSKEIVKCLDPRIAVISCEKIECNSYIEKLLKKKGRQIYTTEKNGQIKIQRKLGNKNIDIFTEK